MKAPNRFVVALVGLTLLAAAAEFRVRYQPAPMDEAGWLIGDCVDYRDMARSLIVNGSVDYALVNPREAARYAEGSRYTRTAIRSNVSLAADGGLVPKHSVLFALALALPYAMLREPGLLLFNWAQCVLLVLLVYWFLSRYVAPPVAFGSAAIFLIDGILPNYTYNVSPDLFGAVLVLGGAMVVWSAHSRWSLVAGGLILGLAVWLRPLNLVGLAALLPLLTASVRARRLDPRLELALWGFAVGVSGYLLLNAYWFGNPLITPYDRILVLNDGVRSIASHRSDMNRPFWASLLPTLLTAEHGFLETAPHWPLVLPALLYLARRRSAEALAIAAITFGPALVMVKYDHWELSHFGNRFLILSAAASALGVGWLVQALRLGRADCLDIAPLGPISQAGEDDAIERVSCDEEGPPKGTVMEDRRVRIGLRAVLLAGAPLVLLGWHTGARTSGLDFKGLSGDWTRAWDDVAIASGLVEFGEFPVAPYLVTNAFSRKGQVAFHAFKETFSGLERRYGTRLSPPWEGFSAIDLFPRRPRVAQRFDDVGRAYLVGLGFSALGKVAPGLIFWLAPVITSFVLLWLTLEGFRAGFPIFGLGVSLLVSISAFCVDMFVQGYSATGFYLISILTCLAYSLGVVGGTPSVSGLIARSAVSGILLAACFNSRSMSITVLPALLLVAVVGARGTATSWRRRMRVVTASVLCLVAPGLLLREHLQQSAQRAAARFGGDPAPGSHDIWITYWQGLGDFDRTHGHVFLDQAGLETLRAHGGRERVSERSEAIMRELVLESIRKEPSWFAGILFQRAIATVSFRKLWPMASTANPGFVLGTTPNEGATDTYWTMSEQADVFRIGRSRLEIPAFLFPLLLAVFAVTSLWRPSHESAETRRTLFKVVVFSALAAISGPVLTTTAGAFEPQAFVVVAFAAFAGVVQIGIKALRARRGLTQALRSDPRTPTAARLSRPAV